MDLDDTEWDQLNHEKWKGIGLTDAIKNVEVRNSNCFVCWTKPLSRTNGCSFQHS